MTLAAVNKFIDDMAKFAVDVQVEAELVTYRVTPVDGAHAGSPVQTAVSIDELDSWPHAPPHWIHLPAEIKFPKTNSQNSPRSAWLKHSRQITGWGDAPPAISWVSHVRGVISEAIS